MELDSRKKSRLDRMMRSKSFETLEVREIGRKEAGKWRGFSHFVYGNNEKWIEDVKKKFHASARQVL